MERAPDAPPPPESIEVPDDAGRTVRLEAPARRIISLIPAATEVILELGAGDRLVGRTDYDVQPELDSLPSIGGGLTPNIEWLASRRPDLVIAWPDRSARSIVTRLQALGIAVYAAEAETLAEAAATIRRLSVLLGEAPRADSLLAAVHARIDSVRSAVAAYEPVEVMYVIGTEPAMVAGPGTFVDEIIAAAGGANVFGDAPSPWPQVSLEEAVRRDPHVVVVAQGEARDPALGRLRAIPGWREIPAVRAGRVVDVDAYLFNRWGPGTAEATRLLAARLDPFRVRR